MIPDAAHRARRVAPRASRAGLASWRGALVALAALGLEAVLAGVSPRALALRLLPLASGFALFLVLLPFAPGPVLDVAPARARRVHGHRRARRGRELERRRRRAPGPRPAAPGDGLPRDPGAPRGRGGRGCPPGPPRAGHARGLRPRRGASAARPASSSRACSTEPSTAPTTWPTLSSCAASRAASPVCRPSALAPRRPRTTHSPSSSGRSTVYEAGPWSR